MTLYAENATKLCPTDPVDRLDPSDPLILPLLRLGVYTLGDLVRVPRWRLARHSCPAGLGDRLLVLQQRAVQALGGQPQVSPQASWQYAMPHLPGRVRTMLRGMTSLEEVRQAVLEGLLGNGKLQTWEREALLEALSAAGWPTEPPELPLVPPPSPLPPLRRGRGSEYKSAERRQSATLAPHRQRRAPRLGFTLSLSTPAPPAPRQAAEPRAEDKRRPPDWPVLKPRLVNAPVKLKRQIQARLQARGVSLLTPWHMVLPPLPLRITRTLTQQGLVNLGAVAQALDRGSLVGLPNFGEESRQQLRQALLQLAETGAPTPPRNVNALVEELLASCTRRERELLTRHFLDGVKLTVLSVERGISRQRVHQILVRILRKWQPRYQVLARSMLAPLRSALRGGALVDRQTVKRMLDGEEVSLGRVALALYLTEPHPRVRVWRQRYLTEQRRQVDRVQLRRIRLALRRRRRARLPLSEALYILRRELSLDLTEEAARALLWRGLCLPTIPDGRVVLQPKP